MDRLLQGKWFNPRLADQGLGLLSSPRNPCPFALIPSKMLHKKKDFGGIPLDYFS
jgi:hypothetical protein